MFTESSVRNESVAIILSFITALLLALLSAVHAAEPVPDWEREIEKRRGEHLDWIVKNFDRLEPTMDPRDGRRWALNGARLVLNRDVARANGYFESFTPPPEDNDIYLIRFLRTLLDCRDLPQLSDGTEAHIVGHIKNWPRNARSTRKNSPSLKPICSMLNWEEMIPMHYATHVVSPCLGLVDGLAEYVSCFGSGKVRDDIARKSGSSFAVESCHIKVKESDLTAHIWRFLYDVARQYRESFDVYGTKKSFEWTLVEDEPHVLHTAKKPEPEIPEKVEVPDYAHLLPEAIRKFTLPAEIHDSEHPVVHPRRRPRRLSSTPGSRVHQRAGRRPRPAAPTAESTRRLTTTWPTFSPVFATAASRSPTCSRIIAPSARATCAISACCFAAS